MPSKFNNNNNNNFLSVSLSVRHDASEQKNDVPEGALYGGKHTSCEVLQLDDQFQDCVTQQVRAIPASLTLSVTTSCYILLSCFRGNLCIN